MRCADVRSTLPDLIGGWFDSAYNGSFLDGLFPNIKLESDKAKRAPIFTTLEQTQKYAWNYLFVGDGVDIGQKNKTSASPAIPARGSEPGQSGMIS
jgi:hypothetical protein